MARGGREEAAYAGAAITWKRAQLKGRGFHYVPVKKERVERAIAADAEFLAAHPTRRR